MKVILLKDVPNVGRKNDVKDVNGGFARNFLLARRLAIPATEQNIKMIATERAHKDERTAREKEQYQNIVVKLSGIALNITVKAGEKGKAFGSVSAAKIVELLKKQGVQIEKDWIDLEGPIKTTGAHDIGIKFPYDIMGEIKVTIKAEE